MQPTTQCNGLRTNAFLFDWNALYLPNLRCNTHDGGDPNGIDREPRAVFNNDRLQIVAVILCSTGVALLAYMDAGITNKRKTMTGVLLAALAAAGSAVYKVSPVFSNKPFFRRGIMDTRGCFRYVSNGSREIEFVSNRVDDTYGNLFTETEFNDESMTRTTLFRNAYPVYS